MAQKLQVRRERTSQRASILESKRPRNKVEKGLSSPETSKERRGHKQESLHSRKLQGVNKQGSKLEHFKSQSEAAMELICGKRKQ